MAPSVVEAQPRASIEFVESSILEAVVPSDTAIDIKEELESWDGNVDDEDSSVLPSIPQRQVLLLDELVTIYIVFRSPFIEDATLKAYLARLAVNVEAYAFSTAPPPEPEAKASPPKELIYSDIIKNSNEPMVLRFEEEPNSHIYVIWKLDVFVSRPRGRYHKPAIYFQPTASLKPAEKVQRVLDDEYLPSGAPTALNLLQPFENDPALAGVHPRLSALRISKIAPTAPVAKELIRPIRTGQRRIFRALPALIWRMRYSKVPASLRDPSLIASLDLEIAHVTGCKIQIDDIQLSLRGGTVKTIADHGGKSMVHRPGDQITYLYKVTPDLNFDGTPVFGTEGHIIALNVKAKVLVSDECQPSLLVDWKTAVDFTVEHNASLVKAAHRLSSHTTYSTKTTDSGSLPADSQAEQGDKLQHKPINITLTVSGPPHVCVGDAFHWDVFIVNRGEKARKLAVLAIPRRKRDLDKQHQSHPSASSIVTHSAEAKDLLTQAVVDENVVYAKQKSGRTEVAELICLTTDVRIGHLASGACYTAELKFLALSAGVLGLEAVRIVDLATQEIVDVRDLPSIVAAEKEA